MPLVIDTQSDPQNLWKSSEIVGDFRFIFTNHIKVSWLFISCQNIFFRPVCMTQYHSGGGSVVEYSICLREVGVQIPAAADLSFKISTAKSRQQV